MMIESKLLLFVSIDLVGSTSYKNKNKSEWVDRFQEFYNSFPVVLDQELNSECQLEIWKFIGDEIIFKKQILDIQTVPQIILSIRNAMDNYRIHYLKKYELDLKATAWTAGIPVINKEIECPIAVNPPSSCTNSRCKPGFLDYIGPSIDAGFRLCASSSKEKMGLSVELVYILTEDVLEDDFEKLGGIFIDDTSRLKGVLNGVEYPLFYIFTGSEIDRARNELLQIIHKETRIIRKYCKKLIASLKEDTLITVPYITEPGIKYNKVSPEHRKIIKNLTEMERKVGESPYSEEQQKLEKNINDEIFSEVDELFQRELSEKLKKE